MMDRYDFFFNQDWCRDGFSLWVGRRGCRGDLSVARNVRFDPIAEGVSLGDPTFILRQEAAQKLFQSMYDAGLRPANGEGSAGQLGATERHLADMRRLVFKEAE